MSNARAATSDAKADITRSGTTLGTYSGDDSGPLTPSLSTKTNVNDTVSVSAADPANSQVRKISVTATTAGGSDVQVKTQRVDANGNTYVDNIALSINVAGQITSASRVPTAETLTLNPATGQYDVAAAPAASANPAAAQTASTTITFPTDYARDATVSQLHTDVASLRTDITSTTATAPSDPAVKSTEDISGQLLDGSFSSLKAWTFPARSVACPAPSFSVWSHTFTIDAHCTLWATVAGQIQAISLATWALMAMFIVLGA